MNGLSTQPNIKNADDFYAELLALHDGKTKAESDAINARLILILANQIGDHMVLSNALVAAGQTKVE